MSSFQMACGETTDTPTPDPDDTDNVQDGDDDNSSNLIKIMPLGDSLTEQNTPGYRGHLYQMLKEAGFNIDFVGVNKSIPSNGGDPDHSGFGGYVIGPGSSKGDSWDKYGQGNIYYHLDKGYEILSKNCDVILLMIGINEYFNNTEVNYVPNEMAAGKLDKLIEKIFDIRPDVTLLVSNITPVAWDIIGFAGPFNEKIPDIVKKYKDDNKKCYFVDTRYSKAWDSKDFVSDQLHLSDKGYKKVADSFFSVLNEIFKQ